jgi:hypothetical protein
MDPLPMTIAKRVAVLVAVVVLSVAVWEVSLRRSGVTGPFTAVSGASRLDPALMPPYDFRTAGLGSERTVVVALAGDCQPCAESVQFYRTVMDVAGMDGARRRFLVLAKYYGRSARDLLERGGFRPHRLLSFPFTRYLDAPGLPTLFVVDGDGKVIGRWIGKLNARQQSEVLQAVRAGRRPPR